MNFEAGKVDRASFPIPDAGWSLSRMRAAAFLGHSLMGGFATSATRRKRCQGWRSRQLGSFLVAGNTPQQHSIVGCRDRCRRLGLQRGLPRTLNVSFVCAAIRTPWSSIPTIQFDWSYPGIKCPLLVSYGMSAGRHVRSSPRPRATNRSVLRCCVVVILLLGCRSASEKELPDLPQEHWPHDTLLLAGSLEGRLIGPVQVLAWDGDSIIVSDAITGQLLWVDMRRVTAWPVSGRTYRPFAPTIVERLSESSLLVGVPPAGFEVVDLRRGKSSPILPPVSSTGAVQVGRFVIDRSGAAVMAPWTAGRFWPSQASTVPTAPGLVRFDPVTGTVHDRFGPMLFNHTQGLVPSIEDQVALSLVDPDSLVVVSLFSADVDVYSMRASHTAPRRFSLPRSFIARSTGEPQPPSRAVFAQFQLSDAVVTSTGEVAVLRHNNYVWDEWNPFLRRIGNWRPRLALELYSLEGLPLRATGIAGDFWRIIRLTHDQSGILVVSPGNGVSPAEPVLLRYPLND